jgi:hypothetical protein
MLNFALGPIACRFRPCPFDYGVKMRRVSAASDGRQIGTMGIGMKYVGILLRFGQKIGPYLLVELLLPGGSLLALLLFLRQRRKLGVAIGSEP